MIAGHGEGVAVSGELPGFGHVLTAIAFDKRHQVALLQCDLEMKVFGPTVLVAGLPSVVR